MNLKLLKCIVFLNLSFMVMTAQQTFYHTGDDLQYRQGLELYENGKYSAAQQIFDKYIEDHPGENSDYFSSSNYLSAMCAVKLFNNDAESRVIKFLNENPENPLRNDAIFNLAAYFYQRKNYNAALDYYSQVDKFKLFESDLAEYYFKSGYCYFLKDDMDKARYAFGQIKDRDSKYSSPALYYYSHINYTQGNYNNALEGFIRLQNDASFSPIVPYYLTQIYFKQKKYDEVVKLGPSLMENVTEKREPEIARITGESYIKLNLFEEAIPFLEKFQETGGSDITKEDKYTLAFAFYKTRQYSKAANLFGQITSGESLLSQNALYHLADCQLRLNDKNKARMAFASASKMDEDPKIREDALFNYALLTYELDYSPFNEAVDALTEYLSLYPDSKRTDEVNNCLVLACMNAKNYRMALESFSKIRNITNDLKKAYQRIAYFRGLELFNNQDYNEAVDMLSTSTKYGNFDPALYALSRYWIGESFYRTEYFDRAIENYNIFLTQPGISNTAEYPLAYYNLGYSYFNLKEYDIAILWFNKLIASLAGRVKKEVLSDTYTRLGDCNFIQMQYAKSIQNYDNAIKTGTGNLDYALFQKGMALGVLGKNNEKISILNELLNSHPGTSYKADAYFQRGESYVKLNQYDKAITEYKKVINDYPKSSYVKKSLLSLGLIYFNSNQNNEAIACYKKVIEDYPGTSESENAVTGLKNVYIDNHDIDGYYAYLQGKGIVTSADLIEQDSLSYLAAERYYMNGDYKHAARDFTTYLDKHPEGRFVLNAQFYKGDCHYRANELAEAITSFDYIIGRPTNKFTEPALLGASRIKLNQKDYSSAIVYFLKLEEIAEVKTNVFEARMGLIKCYSQLDDDDNVIAYADKVLLNEKLSPEQERETRFAKAKALLGLDRQMLALDEFKKISTEVRSLEGAESKYRVAEIYYQRKDIGNAEKVISDFADKTTPHQYWMAKSFLLWADIFKDKGEDFQAVQTLQSLIDYYEKTDDGIITEAKQKQKLLTDKQTVRKNQGIEEEEEIEIEE